MNKYFLFVIYIQIQVNCINNLICRGNFESYITSSLLGTEHFGYFSTTYFAGQPLCWYNQLEYDVFQVKLKTLPQATKTAQLVATIPYTLCQIVYLEISKIYNLQLNTLNPISMTNSTITILINSIEIHKIITIGEKIINFGSINFTATQNKNVICFKPQFYYPLLLAVTNSMMGPCIDNVTLIKISTDPPIITNPTLNTTNNTNNNQTENQNFNQTQNITENYTENTTNISTPPIQDPSDSTTSTQDPQQSEIQPEFTITQSTLNIFCYAQIKQLQWKITYDCTEPTLSHFFSLQLFQQLSVLFQGTLQMHIKILSFNNGIVTFDIFPNKDCNLADSVFTIPDIISPTFKVKFFIQIKQNQKHFNLLKSNQTKALNNIAPLLLWIIYYIKNIHNVLRAAFSSYFVISLISFWNLSLMYNFLNISTIPAFSRKILQELAYILLKADSFINLLQEIFHIQDGTFDFENTVPRQTMDKLKNGYSWFGMMNLSTGVIQSNFQSFFVLSFLILKTILAYSAIRLLPKKIRKYFPNFYSLLTIFISQLVSLVPFFLISSTTVMLNNNSLTFPQKINNTIQFLIMILCSSSIFIKYLINQKHKKIRIQAQSQYMLFQEIIYITIPILIVINSSSIFIIINTITLIIRCFKLFKLYPFFYKRQKIYNFIITFIWISHHSIYLMFFITEIILKFCSLEFNRNYSTNIHAALKIAGVATIFTVLLGGLIQLLNFTAVVLIKIYFLKNIIKQLCKGTSQQQILIKGRQMTKQSIYQITTNPNKQFDHILNHYSNKKQKKQKIVRISNLQLQKMIRKVKNCPTTDKNSILKTHQDEGDSDLDATTDKSDKQRSNPKEKKNFFEIKQRKNSQQNPILEQKHKKNRAFKRKQLIDKFKFILNKK